MSQNIVNLVDHVAHSNHVATRKPDAKHESSNLRRLKRKEGKSNCSEVIDLACECGDEDILQVYSYPRDIARTARATLAAACVSSASSVLAASRKRSYPVGPKSPVERITEVFPLVSRRNVASFLTMAASFVSEDDEEAIQTVLAVLSDDPRGTSVTEKSIAAVAVSSNHEKVLHSTDRKNSNTNEKAPQLECNCCFAEYDFKEMVSCRKGGHLFCKTCLQKHTEQRVFGLGNFGVKAATSNGSKAKAVEILCMHSSGCTSGFHDGQLRRALSEKVMKKYDELQYQAVIEHANMKDASKCPKCEFIAIAQETLLTFPCPRCNFKSCRKCGEEAHPGILCDQVENEKETSGRKAIEEAMSHAKIRKCPRPFCRKPFLKEFGCNKITCSCGAYVCYMCRKEIPKNVAYNHFCQIPHCTHESCNKCALYANTDAHDRIAVQRAASDAVKSVANNGAVKIDLKSLLKDPSVPSEEWGRRRYRRFVGGA